MDLSMNLFICNAKKNEFSVLDFFSKWKNPYKSVNLFTVNNEILNENIIFWVYGQLIPRKIAPWMIATWIIALQTTAPEETFSPENYPELLLPA